MEVWIDFDLWVLLLNVCGVKNKFNYDEFVNLINKYDIVGLIEIKMDDIDKIEIFGFVIFMKNRKKLMKICFGGIMLVVKDDFVKYVKIINIDCKYVFWFKLSKVLLNIKDDLLCGVIYILLEGSKYFFLDCFFDIE